MYKKTKKVVASILVMIIALANISTIGIYGGRVYASEASIKNQTSKTNVKNVNFDVYFASDDNHSYTDTKLIKENNKIYAKVEVENEGYLKNSSIIFQDSNFEIEKQIDSKDIAKVSANSISLNQIKNGNSVVIEIPISFNETENINLTEFSKESKVKFIGTYVNGNGKEVNVEKEIKLSLSWTNEVEAILDEQVSKFIPYSIGNEAGVILQTIVKSSLKGNILPVKETNIEINVPQINGIKPEKVSVIANSTKATNGDETAKNFTQENYSYDKENNKLSINVKNIVDEESNIKWAKECKDEFIITYNYGKEAAQSINEDGAKISLEAISTLNTFNTENSKVQGKFKTEGTLKDQINNIVDFSLKTQVSELSKGYIYANYDAKEKIDTEYEEKIVANVGYTNLVDKIEIEALADKFVKADKSKLSSNNTYFKKISIDKDMINKLLGEDGIVNIYNEKTLIAKVDKNTKADENNIVEIDLAQLNISSIRIETTKPVTEGNFEVDVVKAIKSEVSYSKVEMSQVRKIETSLIGRIYNEEQVIVEQNDVKDISLVEVESKAELVISNENLSTIVTNEDIEVKAILKTDSLYNKLFKDPVITLEFPSYIENLVVKDIKVLFEDKEDTELKIKNITSDVTQDGKKIVTIVLQGTQTKYAINAVSGGTNIVLTTDMTLNKLTPSKSEVIKMYYSNSNVITNARAMSEENETEVQVNFVAPTGVVTTSSISSYKENAKKLTSVSGEEQTAVIDTMSASKVATYEMTIINNYENTIDNINILGRIPAKGNRNVLNGEDFGSTFDIKLQSAIAVSGVDASKVEVYYSENINATKDLSNTANGWTKTPANIANVKSYLIVVNNHSMNKGEIIGFSYTGLIPESLQYNESAYENYVVYFNNNISTGTISDSMVSTKLGVTTGRGPILEATMSSNIAEDVVLKEGDTIKYTISVKNVGTEVANNVVAKIRIPTSVINSIKDSSNNNIEIKDGITEINIGNIDVGKSINKEIIMNIIDENLTEEEITIKASILADKTLSDITTNQVIHKVKNRIFITFANSLNRTDINTIKEGEEYKYYISVGNNDFSKIRENTIVTIILPQELSYKNIQVFNKKITTEREDITSKVTSSFDSKTRQLIVNLGTIEKSDTKQLYLDFNIENLPEGTYYKDIAIKANVKANDVESEDINIVTDTINKTGLKVTQISNITENTKIALGEDYKYIVTIENLSKLDMNNVKVIDKLPNEIKYSNTKLIYENGKETITYDSIESGININLKERETIKLEINVIANAVEKDTDISNLITIEHNGTNIAKSNTISHILERHQESIKEDENPGTIVDPEQELKRIVGKVWKDENKNGIKDTNEVVMSDVEIMLFNNVTGEYVKDNNGNVLKQLTDSNGSYIFRNLQQGRYTIVFVYDTANYSATKYKVSEANEEVNSDAIDTKTTIDGITRIAAITEEIKLTSENVYNIDLGLIENPKFDLKLDKSVSKITVQNSTGTKVYEYNNSKLAKVDIVGKYVNETTIVVEYKIKVTNEGAVTGYVKKLVDYIPTEMKFNSELNRDWYISDNGYAYNSSLANIAIAPEESKEVTLILTKKLTEDSLQLINNTAEIYEASNDLGLDDIDSVVANKKNGEDDMSSADILPTVKTGETIMIIGLSTIIIAIIGIAAYFIKKKVLR